MKTPLLIILLLSAFIGISQTTVNGSVVDQNNEPIPGANVVIVGKAIGATADFDGLFKLETSEVPPFQLKITSVGYSEATENVTENNQTFTIVLNEAQTFLDEVVISASRTPERIFESPVSVERFGLKEIKNTASDSKTRWLSIGEGKQLHLIPRPNAEIKINKAIHFALTTSNLNSFIKHLTVLEIDYSDWLNTPNKDYIRKDGIKQVYFQDPNGYWIEINDDVK